MSRKDKVPLAERVARAAEAALAAKNFVCATDILVGIGWLDPGVLERWRRGQIACLEQAVQANLHRISEAMRLFRSWAVAKSLFASETAYIARTPRRQTLRFSVSGDASIEAAYRTHWVSPELSEAKRERLADKASAPPELVVVLPRNSDIIGDSGIRMRYEAIKRFVEDKRAGIRDLVVGDSAMARRVEIIADVMPNFSQLVSIVVGAIKASEMTRKPMRVPPLLLVGEPGVGKTKFMRELADALNVPTRPIALNLCDDVGQIVGHSPSWHGTRVGLLARLLLDSQVACPLIYADELDKLPSTSRNERPANALISLLEEENSRTFRDALLDFPMRADRVQWIFSANTLAQIPAPLCDRLLVFAIPALQLTEKRSLVKRRIDIRLDELGTFALDHDDAVLEALSKLSTRTLIQTIDIAIGVAARQSRAKLKPQDFYAAIRVLDREDAVQRKSFGFVSFT